MKKPESSQSKVHRRDLLKGVAAAGAAIAAGSYGTSTAKGASQSNLSRDLEVTDRIGDHPGAVGAVDDLELGLEFDR